MLAIHQPNANVTYNAKRMQSHFKIVTKCYLTTGIVQIEIHQQKSTPYSNKRVHCHGITCIEYNFSSGCHTCMHYSQKCLQCTKQKHCIILINAMQKKCFVIKHSTYVQRTCKKLHVYRFNIFAVHQLKPVHRFVCCIIIISPFQHFIKSGRAFNLSMYSPSPSLRYI